jgi:hypothetical protein
MRIVLLAAMLTVADQSAECQTPLLAADKPKALSLDRWQRHVIDSAKPWRSLFIAGADMDRDGHTDVVTGGWWYRNPGKPSGDWTRQDLGQPIYNMAAVFDFDFDGDFDVLGTAGKASDPNSTLLCCTRTRRLSLLDSQIPETRRT